MLPSTVPIVRSDFEGTFDAHDFLLQHCQYRTLGDLKQEVLEWELQLQKQLETLVNENYDELVGSRGALQAAQEDLSQVRLEVLQFEAATERSASGLRVELQKAQERERRQAELDAERALVLKKIQFLDWLALIESQTEPDEQQLVQHSRVILSLERVAGELEGEDTIKDNLSRVKNARLNTLKAIGDQLKRAPSFELMKAKSWLL